jgi:hypothetical protein
MDRFAEEAKLPRPEELAFEWQMLMSGSVVAAAYGDNLAAKRARKTGENLLASKFTKGIAPIDSHGRMTCLRRET